MTVQWKDLEKITKDMEDNKPKVIAYVHHNPNEILVVKSCADSRVKSGRVYLGDFNAYNQIEDNTYKNKCKELETKVECLRSEIWCLRNKIETVKDLL